jgi:hypothetical protein
MLMTAQHERLVSDELELTGRENDGIRWLIARQNGATTKAIAEANKVSTSYVRRQLRRAKEITIHWTQERLFRALHSPNFKHDGACEHSVHAAVDRSDKAFCLRCMYGLQTYVFKDRPALTTYADDHCPKPTPKFVPKKPRQRKAPIP